MKPETCKKCQVLKIYCIKASKLLNIYDEWLDDKCWAYFSKLLTQYGSGLVTIFFWLYPKACSLHAKALAKCCVADKSVFQEK